MSNPDWALGDYVCGAMADCLADRITSVDRLVPGENHAIYKVCYLTQQGDRKEVLVRLGSRDEAGRLRAEREARVLRKVGGAAGPQLYDFSADAPGLDRPVMCIEFVAGRQAE